MSETNSQDEQRLSQQKEIFRRIEDLVVADADGTAVALMDAALAMIARSHPAILDRKAKRLIKDNYLIATDTLMAERAMSEEGVILALVAAVQMGKIAIDYSPLSHCKSDMDSDLALGQHVGETLWMTLEGAFEVAASSGISAFGVATTMILFAVAKARDKGTGGIKLARPLLNAFNLALQGSRLSPDKDAEKQAMEALWEQMGISRAEARKYLEMAKKLSAG